MIIADPATAAHVRLALERHAMACDPARLPAGFLRLLEGVRRYADVLNNIDVDAAQHSTEAALMTRTEVANLAGVHPATVSRWGLPKIGRRYPAAVVRSFLDGRDR